jgi:hypothetical protein
MAFPDDYLNPPTPIATPAMAYASANVRAAGIAKHFAYMNPIEGISGLADENKPIALIAHMAAATDDPCFTPPPQTEPSSQVAPRVLMQLTGFGELGTSGAYDFALKGLMVIAYRYRHLLNDQQFAHILNDLVPPDLHGRHDPNIEVHFDIKDVPESENHVLMIESSRYLINQLRNQIKYTEEDDNNKNGLTAWLLAYLQRSALHDFLEFNARPYSRYTLSVMFNLYEFALDTTLQTAAQIILDYIMVKFALSSSRLRRVCPFRRLQVRINQEDGNLNDLLHDQGEEVAGFFGAFVGLTDGNGTAVGFPASYTYNGSFGGASSYRPPLAAYVLALDPNCPASFHRFYHGTRPRLPDSPDIADGGLEFYYKSPSFLLSSGGMFLNSGYGHDEVEI